MRIARTVAELERRRRAVAIGSFDGVHCGHLQVIAALRAADGAATVLTFDPHPRVALGNRVELLTTLERRLELLAEAGVEETLVLHFDLDLARLEPEEFVERVLRPIGAETIVAGEDFRFGHRRAGDVALLRRLGLEVRPVPLLQDVSSSAARTLVREGRVRDAAVILGRSPELDGVVVAGDARGGTLGFPTANLAVPADLVVPRDGVYAGEALAPFTAASIRPSELSARGSGKSANEPSSSSGSGRHRAAVSIGTNPHYGGTERRIEAFLLDFEGDLYGRRIVLELWDRLRDQATFASEDELVAQIARDVEATRSAVSLG